jgi:hypothetical protein
MQSRRTTVESDAKSCITIGRKPFLERSYFRTEYELAPFDDPRYRGINLVFYFSVLGAKVKKCDHERRSLQDAHTFVEMTPGKGYLLLLSWSSLLV